VPSAGLSSSVPAAAPEGPSAPAAGGGPARGGESRGRDPSVRVVVLPWQWLSTEPLPAPGEATVSMQPVWARSFSWAEPAPGSGAATMAGGTIGLAPGLGWVLFGANVPGSGYGSSMLTGLEGRFSPEGAPWSGTVGGGLFESGAWGRGGWGEVALSAEAGRVQGGVTARGYLPGGGGARLMTAAGASYRVSERFRLGVEAGAFAGGGRVRPFVSPAVDARVGDKNTQVRVGPGGVSWRGAF
jgi:hypothetical protein